MSFDLALKPTCSGCGSTADLYGSNCKHMTLCLTCGKKMAESGGRCYDCGAPLTRLIREYNVRASSSGDKNYFIGRFATGLPSFSKKKSAENKWTLIKDGLQGRQVSDALREKYKNKPWLLEDEISQFQYHGQLEGGQSATYYLLMLQGKEFTAIPAGSWYNFNKVAHYKQLTLEEAEEKMKNRRKTADGYERWMMKAANNGPALFGEAEKILEKDSGPSGGGKGRKKSADDEEGNVSDKGEEDGEQESARMARLQLNKKEADDDDEGPRGGDFDDDDDNIDKGDDWEHEEIFTDDDEALGNDPEEREDLAPEIPAPPEIKQDDDEEEEEEEGNNEKEGGLSKSGKELKRLLGRTSGMNESDADDDNDSDDDEEDRPSPVLTPKVPKEEPAENGPSKSTSTKGAPSSSKSSKGKRKLNGEDTKSPATATNAKKVKTENEQKPSVKEETSTKSSGPSKASPSAAASKGGSASPAGPVTEDEIRAVLVMQRGPVTTSDLVAKFRSRLKCKADKNAFADILKRISKVQKINGQAYIVLRDK